MCQRVNLPLLSHEHCYTSLVNNPCHLQEEEEEDPVDPREELDEKCGDTLKCSKLREVMDECTERVNSKSNTTETCVQELFDFIHCVDHCVSFEPNCCSIHHSLEFAIL